MKKKLKKKEILKIVLFVTIFIIALVVFSDWEHFKEGLYGLYQLTEFTLKCEIKIMTGFSDCLLNLN